MVEAHAFAVETLIALRTDPAVADRVAQALVDAEASGLAGHGLMRLESYGIQTLAGKIDGQARPRRERLAPAAIGIDAALGFSYPAIDLAVEALQWLAREQGIALAAIRRGHHAGAIGLHVERLARSGLVGLMAANAPACIAAWGGRRALFGTNPLALAAPRAGGEPVVIDLSVARIARGQILKAALAGEPIAEGLALDRQGLPTTDAQAALDGLMLPIGQAKGTALALLIEILAAPLTGGRLSAGQSSYFDASGDPPQAGHLLIAIDPQAINPAAAMAVAELAAMIEADAPARVPGSRRQAARAVAARDGLFLEAGLEARLADLKSRSSG